MSAMNDWLTSAWGERLGWMLVHSVWEVALIAAVYALVLIILPRGASTVRYATGCVVLLLMIVALPVTFVLIPASALPTRLTVNERAGVNIAGVREHIRMPESTSKVIIGNESTAPGGVTVFAQAANPLVDEVGQPSWQSLIAPLLPWLTALWITGVMLFSLRLLVGLASVERLRRVGLKTIESEIAASGAALANRLGIRRVVKLAESALVHVPTVIGYLRPVVLLPAVSLTGLSTREIEFLLAHELAHIRRHDYLHNIVQGVIETLLFYHPAMWWVSSCVRRERENCCDDLVVSTLENRAEYARTLFALEQRRTSWTPSLAASDGRLLHRIRRLIGSPTSATLGRQWGKGLAGFVVLLLVSVPFAAAVRSLAAQRQTAAAAEDKKSVDADKASGSAKQNSSAPPAVRIVAGPHGKVTFEGEETTWDGLEALLRKVPDRGTTVLEVAISTEDLSVREMKNAISAASSHGRNLGFKYSSYIGLHPLGSKGTRPQTANATDKSKEPRKKVGSISASSSILKFPDGSSVEFVGVAPHPADGKTWWAPNGMPLEKPPWPQNGIESHVSDRLSRQFGFLFHDPPANVDLNWWNFRSEGAMAGTLVVAFDADDKQVKNALGISTSYDKDAKEATISVGVAARPRRFVLSVDATGKIITGSKDWVEAPTKVLVEAHKDPPSISGTDWNNVETFFGFDRPNYYDFDDFVVAIDLDGKEHFPFGFPVYHDDGSSPTTIKPFNRLHQGVGFDIPLSRIKEFHILARSFKTDYNWFTFENVSLQPDHRTQPKAHIDQYVAAGPQSQRVVFTPRHGTPEKANWSHLVTWNVPNEKPCERLMAHVTLEGEFPVQRNEDKKPIFKVKLMAGSDESLNIKLTRPDGTSYGRVLHRGKTLAWKLDGKTYEILYPDTFVALDQPAEEASAMITVTCRRAETGSESDSFKENKKSDAHKDTNAPDDSPDDSKNDGGSDFLRNIRALAAPILAELALKNGYGLAEGQVIRRVPPPFPELRMTYYRVGNPSQWQAIPGGPSAMSFRWIDGHLENWGMTFGSDSSDGYSVSKVIDVALGLKPQQIEGPKRLLTRVIPGDWVIQKGHPDELVAQQLAKILQDEVSLPVKLEFRVVDRDVYVASGDYKLSPLPGRRADEKTQYTDRSETTDPVEIFGQELVPNSGSGGGCGNFAEFLQWTSQWIDAPIVDEVGTHPNRALCWRLHGHSPATDEVRKKDHDADLVLRNISKQTNLKFAKEKRPLRLLFVEQAK